MPNRFKAIIGARVGRHAALPAVLLRAGVRSALAGLVLLLAACGGQSNGSGPPQLRVIDEAYGAGNNFDLLVNSASAATNLGFGQITAFQPAAQGGNTVVFEATGTTTTVLTASFAAATGSNYSVFALQGSSALSALVVAQDNSTVSSGQARLSFVHAYPGEPALDFYLTSPTATLPASPTISALSYSGASSSGSSAIAPVVLTVNSGDYRIRAVANGDTSQTVVFDSGAITLESGADFLLAVVQTSGSAAAFSLMSIANSGSVFQILDQRVQVRMGNFAPALGAVDTYLDPSGTANSSTNLFATDVVLGNVTAYQAELPGAYEGSAALTGQTLSAVQAPLPLSASTSISVFAIGLSGQASPANLQLLTLLDDLSAPPSGMAKLRIVQLAPDLVPVDVVLLDVSGTTPVIAQRLVVNLAYSGASTYLPLTAGSYTVALAPTGQDTPLLPLSGGLAVNLTAGLVATLVVDGCRYPSSGICGAGSTALQLVSLQDN
jgi:hypothetical protein